MRGTDATGFALLRDNGTLEYLKHGVPASEFVNMKEWKSTIISGLFTGHARAGTGGKASDNVNNHPIYSKVSGLCIAHNGVIRNETELKNKHKLKCDGLVDSEVILRMIEKYYLLNKEKGIENAIKRGVSKIQGSMTFSLVQDGNSNNLYLVRSSNPLVLGYVEKLDTIFYASTEQILNAALSRTKVYYEYFRKQDFVFNPIITDVEDDRLLTISREGGKFSISEEKIDTHGGYVYVSHGNNKGGTLQCRDDLYSQEEAIEEIQTEGVIESTNHRGQHIRVGMIWDYHKMIWRYPTAEEQEERDINRENEQAKRTPGEEG